MSSIFISHSSKDNQWAASLTTKLIEQGHRSLFLDFDPENGIPAGRKWETELYTQLKGCQAVIVLCSQYSMKSPWCFAEITHARALGKKIFPIKIDDCEIVGLLRDLQVTDHTRIGETETYARLERGLKESGLDPKDAFDWDNSRPPYPGLLSFEAEDAAIYAGRDSDIHAGQELLSSLRSFNGARLVLVLGASGSGKSSLVKAGLLPRLKKDVKSWVVLDPFRPRKNPLSEFNYVLQACFKQHGIAVEGTDCKDKLLDKTASADVQVESVVNALEQLSLASGYRDTTVLITIDQVEELLGGKSLDPATQFLTFLQLLLANEDSPVMVLGTLRSDYLGVFQSHPILKNVFFKTLPVNPLGTEGIAQAIQHPADLVGLDLGPGLRELLVNDTKDGNALPLLAFTLRELWQRYGGDGLLEISEYKALGGLKGAVANAAQTILDGYVPSTDPTREAIEESLRRAFLKLVRIDEEGKAVRRIATWQELPDGVHPLLERFAGDKGRLLTVSGEYRQVEVSHEALFSAWPLLNKWITDSKEHLLQKQRIEAAAAEWQAENQRKFLLLKGERLQEVQNFIDSFGEDFPLNPLGQAFLSASQEANAVQEFFILCRTIARTITIPLSQVLALVAIAKSEAQAGEVIEARDILEQALQTARWKGDSSEQGQMLVEIAQAYRELDETDLDKLEQVIRVASGFPNTLLAIANAAGQMQDVTSAQAVLEQTLKVAETITDNAFGYAQPMDPEDTDEDTEKITDKNRRRSLVLIPIACAYVQLHDATSAQGVLEQTLKATESITDRNWLREDLISIANAAGQLQDATSAQAVLEQTLKAAERFRLNSHGGLVLISIARAYVQLQDATSAQVVLEQTLKVAETMDFYWLHEELILIANAAGQLQNATSAQAVLEQTLKAAERFTLGSQRSLVLISIARAYVQLQDATSAQAILEQTLKAVQTITDDSQRSEVLISIASAYVQLQDTTSAQAVLEQTLKAAETITVDSKRSYALSSIANAASQLQDTTSAQAVLEQTLKATETITDDSWRGSALRSISNTAGQLQDTTSAQAFLEKTLKAAETITDDSWRSEVLRFIANAYVQLQNATFAQAVLEQALKAAETITDDSQQSYALREITKIYSSFDLSPETIHLTPIEPVAAEAVFEQALTKIAEPSECSDYRRHRDLISIVQDVDKLQNSTVAKSILDKAMNIANSFSQSEYRNQVITTIYVKYGQLGEWKDALLSLQTTPDEEKTESLRQILSLWLDQHP
jgi:tetratricopeptide (TPR) repeat protein